MHDELKDSNKLTKIREFFLSLRTTIGLLVALLCLLLYGSFVMPVKAEFQSLSALPLFQWMAENSPGITWWLWAIIGVILILTANTLLCSLEAVLKKKGVRHWVFLISPQIVHIGFLLILLAHLLSAYNGFRGTAVVYENAGIRLPNGTDVLFRKISADVDPAGYVKDWSADIEYFQEGRLLMHDRIRPNSPSFEKGLGIYIKNVQVRPYPAAMIEVSREPGAAWALGGSMLFIAGMIMLLLFKIKREGARG
jgi:cytochrome c biogenesis protein ResB